MATAMPISSTLLPAFTLLATLGAQQETPLHLAARQGDVTRVRELLAQGENVHATNALGATPLHGAVNCPEAVHALLAAGAEVDAEMPNGATPLLVAIGRAGSGTAVDALLAHGADPTRVMKDVFGVPFSALVRAADAGDAALVARLLDDPRVRQARELVDGALVNAAFRGHLAVVDSLLAAGADTAAPDFLSGHALNRALYADQRQVALRLLPHCRDLARTSGLATAVPTTMWAGYNESGDADLVQRLLESGGDPNAVASNGESLRRWAEKRGATPLTTLLRARGAVDAGPVRKDRARVQREIPASAEARAALRRTGVQKALGLLQRAGDRFLANGHVRATNCVSCHHQSLPALALGRARQRGYAVDEAALARQLWAQERELRAGRVRAYSLTDPVPDAPNNLGFSLLALHALNIGHDGTIEAMTWFLVESQRADGSFASHHRRPPLEEGPIVGTALAVGGLRGLAPRYASRRVAEVQERAGAWLLAQDPDSRNQQLFQLLGLGFCEVSARQITPFAEAAAALQGSDGGVAPFPTTGADAWTTALFVFALRECGLGATFAPSIRRANDWLLARQHEDGSWWQESRTWPLQPHFDGGFPHGRDQWIAAAATALAAIALLEEEPAQAAREAFGTAQELAMRHPPGSIGEPVEPAPAAATASPRFEPDILPLLRRSCTGCHGGDRPKGGLDLTTRAGLLAGGQSRDAAVVPGDPERSPLLRYVTDQVEDLEMPPLARRGRYPRLDATQVATVRAWIAGGAP